MKNNDWCFKKLSYLDAQTDRMTRTSPKQPLPDHSALTSLYLRHSWHAAAAVVNRRGDLYVVSATAQQRRQ